MKCNINRTKNTMTTRYGLESNIHQQMSYRDIIDNVICFGPNDIPQIPDNVKMITATIKIPNLGVPVYAFVDVASIKGANYHNPVLSPVTSTLLDRYGVTPDQFAEDFCREVLVTTIA